MGDRKEMDVMFDTENSIILGDYLDLLLNRTMEQEEEYGERPKDGVYIRCSCDREIQNTITKLGLYEYILYADYNQKITKETADKPKKIQIYSGGIRMPHYHGTRKMDEGSGNIVISGKPGVGKSTLAFQFAAACASSPNDGIAVYFSLDVDEKQIVKSMCSASSGLHINYLCDYPSKQNEELFPYDSNSNKGLEMLFRSILHKQGKKIVPQLILPKLSQRGIYPDAGRDGDSIFLQRMKELRQLLRGIYAYNMAEREKEIKDREPLVKLVVIDSLDVFGERTLTREEINRLFMLFKEYGIIGVFTMGSVGYESLTAEAVYQAAVTYQADVVIELKKEFYNNYTCSYFAIPKSRYIRHVLGHHPYKVESNKKLVKEQYPKEQPAEAFSFQSTDLNKKIVVLPSLHYRISASENSVTPNFLTVPDFSGKHQEPEAPGRNKSKEKKYKKTIFGIKEMIEIMPNHFKDRSMAFPQIITISGSSGLYKSDIALNALIAGIVDAGEKGLIVRLGDRDAFAVRGVRFEKKLLKRIKENYKTYEQDFAGMHEIADAKKPEKEGKTDNIYFYEKSVSNDEPNKYTLRGWTLNQKEPKPQLLEVTFKNGALLPEEFVDEICQIINRHKIKRVVFVDLKYIGSSYPFLVNSDTSGDLFLSAFVHIMRNYGMHVIMSSSESGLEASDVELRKAGILADAILRCSSETSKGRYKPVYITGEGLITDRQKRAELKICEGKDYRLLFCEDGTGRAPNAVMLRPFDIDIRPVTKKKQEKQEKQEEKQEKK